MSQLSLAIGVDVGGTKVAGGVVDPGGAIVAEHRLDTPAGNADATVEAIAEVINKLRREHDVDTVGVAIAGFIDVDRSTVYVAPNLAGFRDLPLRARLEELVGLTVVIENDANAAAWGEFRFGAGQGTRSLVCVTVGTGVGGGVVIAGELLRGGFGIAGEIGHIQMVEAGRLCGCGQRGCWEQYASGGALLRAAREGAAEGREHAGMLLALGDGTPEGIQGRHVTQAAREGDRVAQVAFEEIGQWMGQGLADLAAVLDPDRFVLGGGVSEAGALLLDPTVASFRERLTGAGFRPAADVVLASLGNDAGLVGVADLARAR